MSEQEPRTAPPKKSSGLSVGQSVSSRQVSADYVEALKQAGARESLVRAVTPRPTDAAERDIYIFEQGRTTMPNDADAIRIEVETRFAQLEADLAKTNPGVIDVLRVYGEYDAALRQMDAYFAALNPIPQFSTSNSTG